jgi:hypothetical protein
VPISPLWFDHPNNIWWYKSWLSLCHSFLQAPVTSTLVGSYVFLSIQ